MRADLLRLVPDASAELAAILDPARGPVERPNRSEIFGPERFAQHGRSLAATHRADAVKGRAAAFFPRFRDNMRVLREAGRYIAFQATNGLDVSPAAEWLLDNFHLIEAQLEEIADGLPRRYFRDLPVLIDEPLAGLPRIYSVAWAFVAHTDGAFDEDLLIQFLQAYQSVRPLTLAELWALPTTLRVVLVENLRRLAERVATNKAARAIANLCCDRIEHLGLPQLDELMALLNQRGAGRVFLAQMVQGLQDPRGAASPEVHAWLAQALPDVAAVQIQQPADQAADNLSVSNAIGSLRLIGHADWADIVNRSSATMQLLLTAPLFAAERDDTRNQTVHAVEALARESSRSEFAVAEALIALMQGTAPIAAEGEQPNEANDPEHAAAGHWLFGAGRPALLQALGVRHGWAHPETLRRSLRWAVLPVYLGAIGMGSAVLVAWMLQRHSHAWPIWLTVAGALLMLFPASEAVVAVINRLISESLRPSHLPRLALAQGIPLAHRVLVVVPGMLTSTRSADELAHRLELHHLANPERHAQFALLTDWADAASESVPADAPLLTHAVELIRDLNARYPGMAGQPPRFIVLHRARRESATEQCWMGWERKRGKLEQLIDALATGGSASHERGFHDLGEWSRLAVDTPYIVTLDADTQLPPGRLRELVGVAAHPHNQPRLDASGKRVVAGYGILQPRVATPLPGQREVTLFHWLFAGQCGIDPYSATTSEIYQDAFSEGTFTGKGLLHVKALHAVLSGRLPEGQVLSHDLLEGSIARCATVTDISVIEDAPFHADVAASRVHRWTRGDWQLLPFLRRPGHYGIRAINRWKMTDNLRRSLVAPMSLALLLIALGLDAVSPGAALALVFAAFTAGPLMGAVAGLAPSHDALAKRRFYRLAGTDLLRALCGGMWFVAQLLQLAMRSVDAVSRALYRMLVSRRHLLEWTTAAAAQASSSTSLRVIARKHRSAPIAALVIWVGLWAIGSPHLGFAFLLCALWATAPLTTWWVSRPRPERHEDALPAAEQAKLEDIARDTWRLFERCVGPDDHHLPPDNLQVTPHDMVARRTSPTNIGLYLLTACCARQFGWIGTTDLTARLEATLATLAQLPRHNGHFLNWYDTQTATALMPMYVSTVDSGNLSGHLLAVAQACLELAAHPATALFGDAALQRAVRASQRRLAEWDAETANQAPESALLAVLSMTDPLSDATLSPARFADLLRAAELDLAAMQRRSHERPAIEQPAHGQADAVAAEAPHTAPAHLTCIADHLALLQSAYRQLHELQEPGAAASTAARLRAIAATCQRIAWEADYAFLYDRKRHLLHIGYRVAEQQLDAGYYDLLASESRLTSLLAIAKGDVPVRHWAALGRPFHAVGIHAALRSWSGSMFEYLMPSLVLDEPYGSVLQDACLAALAEQMRFADEHQVPWGISESAYAASDHTLAYQYAPQGVPRLALRRTPPDELVIAPYATALAAQVSPHRAVQNLARLEALGARGRYGFVEALDYTAARQTTAQGFVRVDTFMAHHQGMSIVSIANVLMRGCARRWAMADPHIEAVASLLHERAPREVPVLRATPAGGDAESPQRRAPGLLRQILPGVAAVAPTHLLSNGRYSVALRANGAGWSRWGRFGITRQRDDALRDACGSFFYLRWDRQPSAVSLTQHPAPDAGAHYECTYHADRVCFDATWPEIASHITVWTSPEDDIEFREVELRNLGDRALDLTLLSAFEITLAAPSADEAHPAFSNLFLRAEWQPRHQALVFERTPRLVTEQGLFAAHFIAAHDERITQVRPQVDRAEWRGRNHDASRPKAHFEPMPQGTEAVALDTGLDPVAALSVRIALAPHAKLRLTFCTCASDNPATLQAVIDKYRQAGPIERASLMSATLAGIRRRELGLAADNFTMIQQLTTAMVMLLTRPQAADATRDQAATRCDRRSLWRFGLSGDHPIVLVSAGAPQGIGLLRSLVQALRVWSFGGVACDLVVINAEPSSYLMALNRDITALRERFAAETAAQPGLAPAGFHVLRADDVSTEELATLRTLARLHFNADGRPLVHHVQEWSELHEQAFEGRLDSSRSAPPAVEPGETALRTSVGQFVRNSGEFRFEAGAFQRPQKPWINVLANPHFGAQLSEAGGGYSWALNSRLNQLTPWSNDPVADPAGEHFLLQDLRTREVWGTAPMACGDARLTYRITHGQGYSVIEHRRGDVEVHASWCVDPITAVKQVRLRLINRGHRTQRLRLIGIAEWVMGAGRVDRVGTSTASLTQRLAGESGNAKVTALFCTQHDRSAGFGEGTAFLALATDSDATDPVSQPNWTCDRRECFDARGRLSVPDHFGQRSGNGLDPCAAISTPLTLQAGATDERVFLLGFGATPDEARALAVTAAAVGADERIAQSREHWDQLLGAATVQTPDPLFDAMVNRWLLYQAVSCRLWAKAGFYQAGGAFGFRDQLQDALALAWGQPGMLRRQIVLGASRQFAEGDVQHWWHAPTGAGVRTHFSDDLLWLPYACCHYVLTTGDAALLDEAVPFLEGDAIPPGAEDAYYVPRIAAESASVYEHCARSIDHSLRIGTHGLPLMGTGDWNDGMNRVGHEGRGESVWLAFFLCDVVERFTPIANQRGDAARAARWAEAARGWRAALTSAAWDGQWFKRAFFDDGTPLGTGDNTECRIDLIAQAWSVLSGAAPAAFQRIAMAAMDHHLIDRDAGLIKLLAPPLAHAVPSAGYIQAYPKGVRENGGQYSHAGVWALMAQAALGDADAAYRSFTYLSPAHRAAHPQRGLVYAIEPYVMAGDVYGAPPYVGRGGWSWYTGSAAWLHRAAIESMFGLALAGDTLHFTPCLPSHWPRAEIALRRGERTLRVVFIRASPQHAGEAESDSSLAEALPLQAGQTLRWSALGLNDCFVMQLPPAPAADASASDAPGHDGRSTAAVSYIA